MKKKLLCLVFIMILVSEIFGNKVAPLPELDKPQALVVDEKQVYIAEDESVYIYSLKDFKLVNKFGRRGEGPQEFKVNPGMTVKIQVLPDRLLISSLGKISYFTKNGVFKNEIKTIAGFDYQEMTGRFAVYSTVNEGNTGYLVINLTDNNFKKIKEVCKRKSPFQLDRREIRAFPQSDAFYVHDDKIFFPTENERLSIDIYDKNGNKINQAEQEYERKKITAEDIEQTHNWLKISPRFKQYYEMAKNLLKFPDYYPAIRQFLAVDKKIYVLTYNKKEGMSEFYIFDTEGKFLKKEFIPLLEQSPMQLYPFGIYGGILYQVVENETTRQWDLHMEKF